ncbi:replication initiator, partial [Streptosporangium sp. NPDC002721]|uniref:replication initiator n=1 Tax=Streptosporangium sp. NPDC002721 TaxID=3366188 RepID=UPI0036A23C58
QEIQKVFTQWPRCHRNNVPSSHHENLARSHFSTKSRRYSTTLGDLRQVRTAHRATEARERHGLAALGDETTLVLGHWRFAGSGYSPGEAIMAEHIRQKVATARKIATEREDG